MAGCCVWEGFGDVSGGGPSVRFEGPLRNIFESSAVTSHLGRRSYSIQDIATCCRIFLLLFL